MLWMTHTSPRKTLGDDHAPLMAHRPPAASRMAPMSPSSSSRPLYVPPADVLAKNLRAQELARGARGFTSTSASDTVASSLLMNLGAKSESSKLAARNKQARFQRASSKKGLPSTVMLAVSRLLAGKASADKQASSSSSTHETKSSPPRFAKMMPPLEKAANISSRLPSPMMIFLAISVFIIVLDRVRPRWLHLVPVQVLMTLLLVIPLVLAIVWRHGDLFHMIREGCSLFTHPAEHRLDGVEGELNVREERMRNATASLKKNQAKLDTLRKELSKPGNVLNGDGCIIPSRKAAVMIADGALGAGFDPVSAHEVEQRRREENMRRWRAEWKSKTDQTDWSNDETKENLERQMEDHAHTAYSKRTKELKTKASPTGGKSDKFNFRNMVAAARDFENNVRRASRHSEGLPSGAGSSNDRRRMSLFRRRRRETAPELDARLTMSETPSFHKHR